MNFEMFLLNKLQLVEENKDEQFYASTSLNPNFTWVSFILTDDLPNENKHRIPKEEFANVIKTGMFMPIKMAIGEIKEGHQESMPIGVVTHLKEDGNRVKGLAALWAKEREEDVSLIKEFFQSKKPLNLSWELNAEEHSDDDGNIVLKEVVMNATTLVGAPAYAGRTPILVVASKSTTKEQKEDTNMEELEKLQKKYDELLAESTVATDEVATLKETVATLENQIKTLTEERDSLSTFKAEIEKEKEQEDKLSAIRQKFVDANLEVTDTYFAEKKELLLSMDELAIDFMIQELVAMKKNLEASNNKKEKVDVPPVIGGNTEKIDIKTLATELREAK